MTNSESKVIKLRNFVKRHTINAPTMLRAIAKKEQPDEAFVICWYRDKPTSYHSTTGDMQAVIYQIEQLKYKYFDGDFDDK